MFKFASASDVIEIARDARFYWSHCSAIKVWGWNASRIVCDNFPIHVTITEHPGRRLGSFPTKYPRTINALFSSFNSAWPA